MLVLTDPGWIEKCNMEVMENQALAGSIRLRMRVGCNVSPLHSTPVHSTLRSFGRGIGFPHSLVKQCCSLEVSCPSVRPSMETDNALNLTILAQGSKKPDASRAARKARRGRSSIATRKIHGNTRRARQATSDERGSRRTTSETNDERRARRATNTLLGPGRFEIRIKCANHILLFLSGTPKNRLPCSPAAYS